MVHQNEPVPYPDPSNLPEIDTSAPFSAYWEPRIAKSLEDLCFSATGYQRVTKVHRVPYERRATAKLGGIGGRSGGAIDLSRLVTFDVTLMSTGHVGSVQSLMELIKHRLDEAYLPGVGSLEQNESYIRLSEESIMGRFYIRYSCVIWVLKSIAQRLFYVLLTHRQFERQNCIVRTTLLPRLNY